MSFSKLWIIKFLVSVAVSRQKPTNTNEGCSLTFKRDIRVTSKFKIELRVDTSIG